MDSLDPTSGDEATPATPETFGMGDTLASGRSEAVAIKIGRKKHAKGSRKAQQLAVSPMKDESKQLVALSVAKEKRTRHPRNGQRDIRGNPKKAGGGGKGTWGKITDVLDGTAAFDSRDPNYDPAEENVVMSSTSPPLSLDDVPKTVLPIFKEFCGHGDFDEVIDAMSVFNFTGSCDVIVYSVVEYAMEGNNNVRELASIFLSNSLDKFLQHPDFAKGYTQMLADLPELELDTPDASEVLGKFIARSIADDCLPPAFVLGSQSYSSDLAMSAVKHARTLLSMPHGMVRLDTVWGPLGTGLRAVRTLEKAMVILLEEYVSSEDQQEVERCLKELNVPHFHHEFVYLAIMTVLESTVPETAQSIARCLKALVTAAFIQQHQIDHGFRRIYKRMDDIRLDVPFVYQVMSGFATRCRNEDIISSELFEEMPVRVRTRFVSDSEGHVEISTSPPKA